MLIITTMPVFSSSEVRIKDIARIEGTYSGQLVGYGLVIGLPKTGDSYNSIQTRQSFSNLLKNMGLNIPVEDLRMRNIAAVMVTSDLSTATREGDRIDILVSSVGDATDLTGGTLLLTPLRGLDGRIRATAQGSLITESDTNANNWKASSNVLAGRIPNGALVVESINNGSRDNQFVNILLNRPDYSTSRRISEAIESGFGADGARAVDASTVSVPVPPEFNGRLVDFISMIEQLAIIPDRVAKVVINQRTGTVVMGADVRIAPVVVSQGNIKLVIGPEPGTQVSLDSENDKYATLQQVVDALRTLNIDTRDLISIIQTLKSAGVLEAELEII